MNLTDEELYVTMLALTIALETANRSHNRRTLPPSQAAGLLATYDTISTRTTVGVELVQKIERWMADGRTAQVQRAIAARLRDSDGGSSNLVGLDGRPFLPS